MKIMMYFDGTEEAKQALPVVETQAKALNAQVEVVSSLPRGGEAQLKEIGEREEGLAYIKSVLDKEKIPCDTHLLIKGNDAGDDIARFARNNEVDEIVIGTSRKSLLGRFFSGLTARYVIRHTPCPVLVV